MENKRPTGHGKKVGSGSAHVEKGEKVSSRPVGTGSGRTGSFDQRPGENRDGERSTAGKLGLLALLLVLPKKYRRILLIVIAVVAVFGLLTGRCGGSFLGDDMGAYGDLGFGVRFASKRDFAVNVMAAGTYYDKIREYGYYYDENGHHTQDARYLSPSGVSLRIGIEW